MKTAKVVVGALWGDEGKGLMTDYFSSQYGQNCVVVRYCSGANAGHTVVTPDGKRHIFGHFGSGSFNSSQTHLSKYFISNPALFRKEHLELSTKITIPKVTVDKDSIVTTPYDMAINQMVEHMRGTRKHGSCGVGINETVERSNTGLCITVADLKNKDKIDKTLSLIVSNDYLRCRLDKNKIYNEVPSMYLPFFKDPAVKDKFRKDIEFFLENVELKNDADVLRDNENVIFEGAQGLMLSMNNYKYHPHVTTAVTGTTNVSSLIGDLKAEEMEIVYVSRCYATRHGNGYFPGEYLGRDKDRLKPSDNTNVYNKHQGRLRYGILDISLLTSVMAEDTANLGWSKATKCTYNMAITCLDQLETMYISNAGTKMSIPRHQFIDFLKEKIVNGTMYLSYGPTRNDIKPLVLS